MSPARTLPTTPTQQTWDNASLQVVAIGVEYPAYDRSQGKDNKDFVNELYPSTPAMEKTLEAAEQSGINTRNCALPKGSSFLYAKDSPMLDKQRNLFMSTGVEMATAAAHKALSEWGGDIRTITHIISVSSMAFTNPGLEFYVAKNLGLKDVERVNLHGAGCSGGLAALRNAANIACGMTFLGRPARILVVSSELSSVSTRTELDLVHQSQEVRLSAALFGDAASALVLSNGLGEDHSSCTPIYDVFAWQMTTLEGCPEDMALDIFPDGWRTKLSARAPDLTANSVHSIFQSLVARVPALTASLGSTPPSAAASSLDWAVQPGSSKVLVDLLRTMELTDEHARASWDVYRNHGNTSSAAIFGVLDRLRKPDMGEGREWVVGFAFGPGISVESCLLKRCRV